MSPVCWDEQINTTYNTIQPTIAYNSLEIGGISSLTNFEDKWFKSFKKWATSSQNQQSDYAPSEDSDQPGHLLRLIRVFAVPLMGSSGPKLSSCGQRRLWSDRADAQADLSLRWTHSHFLLVLSWGSSNLCVMGKLSVSSCNSRVPYMSTLSINTESICFKRHSLFVNVPPIFGDPTAIVIPLEQVCITEWQKLK